MMAIFLIKQSGLQLLENAFNVFIHEGREKHRFMIIHVCRGMRMCMALSVTLPPACWPRPGSDHFNVQRGAGLKKNTNQHGGGGWCPSGYPGRGGGASEEGMRVHTWMRAWCWRARAAWPGPF